MKDAEKVRGLVRAVSVGRVGELTAGSRSHQTAYVKTPCPEPVWLSTLGFPNDEHVYEDHGGPDRAALVYSFDHYSFWQRDHHLSLPDAAAFGENLTVDGLTEVEVCIGDVFQLGDALVQVSQPRTPCYKIGLRYNNPKLPLVVQETGFTGYLLRVLSEGLVAAGDRMVLEERSTPIATVAEAARIVNRDRHDRQGASRLIQAPGLAAAMRERLVSRLKRTEPGSDEWPQMFEE